MYKIALIICLAFIITNIAIAQEENAFSDAVVANDSLELTQEEIEKVLSWRTPAPPSRLGAVIGLQIPENSGFSNGFGITAYYHQTLSKYWFMSFNTGYNYYSIREKQHYTYAIIREDSGYVFIDNTEEGSVSDIPVSLGFNVFFTQKGVRPYIGVEFGAIFRIYNTHTVIDGYDAIVNNTYSRDIYPLLLFPILGFSAPVSPQLSIDGNVKINLFQEDSEYIGSVNIGVSYSFP